MFAVPSEIVGCISGAPQMIAGEHIWGRNPIELPALPETHGTAQPLQIQKQLRIKRRRHVRPSQFAGWTLQIQQRHWPRAFGGLRCAALDDI